MKIYTKKGDTGLTRTFHGIRVSKASCLTELHGSIDSLQAQIDAIKVIASIDETSHTELDIIQTKLWQLAGEISCGTIDHELIINPIVSSDTEYLEKAIDNRNIVITTFQRFHTLDSCTINEARVRCRELERKLVSYHEKTPQRNEVLSFINRLSDYLFILAVVYNT